MKRDLNAECRVRGAEWGKHTFKTTICVLATVLSGAGAHAITSDAPNTRKTADTSAGEAARAESPYQGIVDRNVFNVHPAAPVDTSAADAARKKQQIPKLTLNGFTTILGQKLVFLTEPPTKPGTPPQTLMLAEGQAQDEVEAKQIDVDAGVVKVVNHGEEQTLDFDHDGTKPAPASGNSATPLMIPPVPGAPPPNVIRPLRSLRSFPRMPNNPYGGNSPSTSSTDNPSSVTTIGGENHQPLTPDQQTMMIEAQRVQAIQNNDPIATILPPTDKTQEVLQGMGLGQNGQEPEPAPQ